jgi:hypothetical protein
MISGTPSFYGTLSCYETCGNGACATNIKYKYQSPLYSFTAMIVSLTQSEVVGEDVLYREDSRRRAETRRAETCRAETCRAETRRLIP